MSVVPSLSDPSTSAVNYIMYRVSRRDSFVIAGHDCIPARGAKVWALCEMRLWMGRQARGSNSRWSIGWERVGRRECEPSFVNAAEVLGLLLPRLRAFGQL